MTVRLVALGVRSQPQAARATAAIATTLAASATRRQESGCRLLAPYGVSVRARLGGAPDAEPPNAARNSAAVANLSAGSFSRAVKTAASTCGGTVRRCALMETGSAVRTRPRICWAVAPVNGGSPTSISYTTHPNAYTSERAVSSRSPIACSGLMYCGVPSDMPVSVMRPPPAALTASAMPKSATSA